MTATTLDPRPGIHPVHALGQALRFAFTLAIAGVITVSLFYLMRSLIAVEAAAPEPAVEQPPITIAFDIDEHEVGPHPPPEPVDRIEVPPPVRPQPVDPQARPVESLTTGIGPNEDNPDGVDGPDQRHRDVPCWSCWTQHKGRSRPS